MQMKRIAWVAAALLAWGMAVPAGAQQDMKIGVVNLGQLVSQSPQAQRARKNMEEQFSSRREELQAQREKLQSEVERLKRDGAVMSEDARSNLEDSIRDQERRLRLSQQEYNEDVKRAEQKEMGSLREDIRAVINEFAQSENYDLIVGDGILFASERIDLTAKVLERLKDRM